MNRMSETKSRRAALVLLLCSGVLWPACSAEGDGNDGGLDAGTDTSDGDAGTDDETTDDTEGAMPVVDPDRILADITWLADAERGGRKAGTPGNAAAVDWAEQRMMDLGLEAAGEVDFRQEVSFAGWEVGGEATVGIDDSILVPGEDYEILQYSGAADVTGELVFVGHGLTIPPYQKLQHPLCPVDETTGWDDYAGIDVTGKIVVVLRHGPGDNQSWHNYCVPQAELQDGAAPVLWNFAYKAANARLHGAKAMIVVQDYYHENEHVSGVTLDVAGFLDDFASVSVDRDLVTAALPDLHTWSDEIAAGAPSSHETGVTGEIQVSAGMVDVISHNVLATLPGTDPDLADEVVVFGAHIDHIGTNELTGEINYGADDNASGSATVLELARAFAESGVAPKRTLLFALFNAEEDGLIGSCAYASAPTLPLDDMIAMFSVDMVGAGNGEGLLLHNGLLPEEAWLAELMSGAAEAAGLPYAVEPAAPLDASDHVCFQQGGVPSVLAFSLGNHDFYHTPFDTADTMSRETVEASANLLLVTAYALAMGEEGSFVSTDAKGQPDRPLPDALSRFDPRR